MLHCRWLVSSYNRAVKSGFYIDFTLKKFAESFVRNFLISGGYFLGEKYIIEGLTKSSIDKVINLINLAVKPILL